jgi:glycosyltransferase involved in cell wall biosynthesis
MAHRLGYLSPSARVSTRPDAETGGPRTHILGTIRGFESNGWKVETFITGDRLPRAASGRGSGRRITGGFARRLVADLGRLAVGAQYGRLAFLELRGRVDWVYERFATLQTYGRRFKESGVPWILEVNGPFFYEAKHERRSLALTALARRVEVSAYRDCDVLVAVTQALRDFIVDETATSADKILVLPNGVDVSFFDPASVEARRLFDGFTLGFVGGLEPWQALDRLFEAMADLRAEELHMNAVVVGDGLMREAWEARAADLGLADRVAFVGRVDREEVPRYMAGFDLGYSGQARMAIGSMYHSPLKLYEYMSMEVPVLAARHGDADAVIQDGETGFLFESEDPRRLRDALRRAIQAKPELPAMGRGAREVVRREHSWERRVSDLIEGVRARL